MITENSERLFAEAQRLIPGGVNSPVRAFKSVGGTPRFISRAEGAYLFDADGNRYTDYVLSWGPLILGHAPAAVVAAIRAQAACGTSFGAPTELEVALARLITGYFLTRWTHYMFRDDIPLTIRALSLYHGWLPFLLLWLVWRFGYDRRGWIVQTLLTWAILPICFFFTDPVRALNGVFGPSGQHPQTWVAPGLWLAVMMVVYPLCVYLPTHLLLRQVFGRAPSPPGRT